MKGVVSLIMSGSSIDTHSRRHQANRLTGVPRLPNPILIGCRMVCFSIHPDAEVTVYLGPNRLGLKLLNQGSLHTGIQ